MSEGRKQMSYFFNEKVEKIYADKGLVRKIICALNCSFYEPYSVIVEKNKSVDAVHFIFGGYCYLTNLYTIEGHEFGFRIRLCERSWYGDYQVMFDCPSTFNMIAGRTNNSDIKLVKIMSIEKSFFIRYADEYPNFRRFIIRRACVRRANFNFRMRLASYEEYFKCKRYEYDSCTAPGSKENTNHHQFRSLLPTQRFRSTKVINKFISEV